MPPPARMSVYVCAPAHAAPKVQAGEIAGCGRPVGIGIGAGRLRAYRVTAARLLMLATTRSRGSRDVARPTQLRSKPPAHTQRLVIQSPCLLVCLGVCG
jgi:hypothetical protein